MCIVKRQGNVDEMVNTAEDFNLRWLYLSFIFQSKSALEKKINCLW